MVDQVGDVMANEIGLLPSLMGLNGEVVSEAMRVDYLVDG